jgi:hypothetical protein
MKSPQRVVIHLAFLVGFRNKPAVLLSWAFAYLVDKPGARVFTVKMRRPQQKIQNEESYDSPLLYFPNLGKYTFTAVIKIMKIRIHRLLIATGIALMPGMTQAQQLADGLLNYWDFEDNAEDTASDYPGSTGTTEDYGQINGIVTFSPGQSAGFGQAGNFPGGAGNNITVADPDGGTNDIDRSGASVTISVWFLLNNRDTGWQALIAHGEGNDYRVAVQGTTNPIPITYNGAGNGTDIVSISNIGAGPAGDATWHHIVAVTVGSTTRLYLDGILEVSGGGGAINENGQNLLCIGCNPTNGREWNGYFGTVEGSVVSGITGAPGWSDAMGSG